MNESARVFKVDIQKEIIEIDQRYYELSIESQDDGNYIESDFEDYRSDSANNEDGYIDDLFESLLYK